MQVRCSFTLDPDSHESHEYAIELLKRWQNQEKDRQDDSQASQQRRNRFHRDLYLSGLVMHQLAPTLPTLLPQVLTPSNLTHVNVLNIMQAAGLPYCEEQRGGLSDSQWQKLTALLQANQPEAVQPQAAEDQTQQLLDGQQALLDKQQTLLQQLLDGQQQLSEQLQTLTAKAAEPVDSQPTTATVDNSELSAKLAGISLTQDKLLSQLKAIRSELKQRPQSAQADATPQPALDDQLSKAARVKAKGLW